MLHEYSTSPDSFISVGIFMEERYFTPEMGPFDNLTTSIYPTYNNTGCMIKEAVYKF